ncbi:MAG: glucosidase, partial [Myxococcales bacterium]
MTTPEHSRLQEITTQQRKWRRWGPYLAERQWGTVREDYSAQGDAWGHFPHDDAHRRAFRWGEDGLLGLCDNRGLICFAPALWNGQDDRLKERLFGLAGPEGNHGEDVKESYFYLDSTPTHSFCRALYKYPQRAFPYAHLRRVNREAGRDEPEIDLIDTGIFDDDRYFDVEVVYAKADVNDLLIELRATNRGPDPAELWMLPTFFCRNTWDWGDRTPCPRMALQAPTPACGAHLAMDHFHLGKVHIYMDVPDEVLFTENESNAAAIWPGATNPQPYVKDAFHRCVVGGDRSAVNPALMGSKAAGVFRRTLEPGQTWVVRARLRLDDPLADPFGDFSALLETRRAEADAFYDAITPRPLGEDERRVFRQALAGMLWSKQYYHLDVARWLRGDPGQPTPPRARLAGRNSDWKHLYNSEVISMPDKWEYPWYAAWDTAFHAIPLALVDLDFAKQQIGLFLREWYMHPNGQIPAYEWSFSDVNPPVQAWAALRIYRMEASSNGRRDRSFLEGVFHKLMLNFTWWVNRKDAAGLNVFEGGFLGLDNIGVFDRSRPLPFEGRILQADATSWMGMFCLDMLEIALELAEHDSVYEDVASKFFEHFLYIAHAMNSMGERGDDGFNLWHEGDGFYYDVLDVGGRRMPMEVRSMVGLIPLLGTGVIEASTLQRSAGFRRRMDWVYANRPELARSVAHLPSADGQAGPQLLALVNEERLRRILTHVLDEEQFLSPHGIRALSRRHLEHPYVFPLPLRNQTPPRVDYEPAESRSFIFGGNSNWRGPVWFPVNYLLIDALERYHRYLGEGFKV